MNHIELDIAEAFKRSYDSYGPEECAWQRCVDSVFNALSRHNPMLKRDQFRAACGWQIQPWDIIDE